MKRTVAICAVFVFGFGAALTGCPKKVESAKEPNPSMPGPSSYSPDAMKAKSGAGGAGGPGSVGVKAQSGGAPSAPKAPK